MKKPKMTNDVIQRIGDKILEHQKLVIVFDDNSSKMQYTQPRGSSTYECACRLLKVDHLFYGPKLSESQMSDVDCFIAKSFLYNQKVLDRVVDPNTLQEEWRLTEYGTEFFYVYTKLLHTNWANKKHREHKGSIALIVLTLGFYAFYKLAIWAIRATQAELEKAKTQKALRKKKRRRTRN